MTTTRCFSTDRAAMPTQTITTQVQSSHAKQLVADVVSAFQQVRVAESNVEDAQVDALRARYEWGREVYTALDAADRGESVAEEVGRRIDRSAAWVRQHARFANAVTDSFPGFDPPIEGYVADCLDNDRSLAWRSAVTWMSDTGTADEDDQAATEWERMRRDVERKLEALEETAETVAEAVLDNGDTMDEEERKAMEGVLTRSQQAIEDNRHLMDTLEDEAADRVECEPYLRFVKDHACCLCGIEDDTTIPHHPNEAYPNKGGTGTKVSDFKAVPACFDCHEDLEETPDAMTVWEESDTDPRAISNELQAEWNAKLVTN